MNKFDIKSMAAALSAAHNISEADAEKFLRVLCNVVLDALRHDGQVKIKGLGTFKLIGVPEREMVDVNSGERITVEARSRISFSPDAVLRDIINKPFVFFDTVVLNDGVVFDDESETDDTEEEELYNDEVQQNDTEDAGEVSSDDTTDSADDTLPEAGVTDTDVTEEREDDADEPVKEDYVPASDNTSSDDGTITDDEVDAQEPETQTDEESVTHEEVSPSEEDTDNTAEVADADIHEKEQEQADTARQETTPVAVNEALSDARSVIDEIQSGKLGDDDDTVKGLYTESSTHNVMWYIFLVLAVLVAAGAVLYGTYGTRWFDSSDSDIADTTIVNTKTVKQTSKHVSPVDSIMADSIVSDSTLRQDSIMKADSTVQEKIKNKKPDKIDPDFYDALDVRVRTGAYRIVGVYKTVEVVKGQTLKSITKAYLGEGMECYMEALNGVKSVQPGDTLQIPELKWRKKRRK